MRVHGLASAILASLLMATAALGQSQLHPGTGAFDQPPAESSLMPISGFSLDSPATDASRGDSTASPLPSDGLRLQIYGSDTPTSLSAPEAMDNPASSSAPSP